MKNSGRVYERHSLVAHIDDLLGNGFPFFILSHYVLFIIPSSSPPIRSSLAVASESFFVVLDTYSCIIRPVSCDFCVDL